MLFISAFRNKLFPAACFFKGRSQCTAQKVRPGADRCGKADHRPLQNQPQRLPGLPEREGHSVRRLLCVLRCALLRRQKVAQVSFCLVFGVACPAFPFVVCMFMESFHQISDYGSVGTKRF